MALRRATLAEEAMVLYCSRAHIAKNCRQVFASRPTTVWS